MFRKICDVVKLLVQKSDSLLFLETLKTSSLKQTLTLASHNRAEQILSQTDDSETNFYLACCEGLHSLEKAYEDFFRTRGFMRIFDGFSLKTKGFLPNVYEIFGSEMPGLLGPLP